MKAGYKVIRVKVGNINFDCVTVFNYSSVNVYEEHCSMMNEVGPRYKNLVGVWKKKGTNSIFKKSL